MSEVPHPPQRRPASTPLLLAGIALGVVWGLFFGESGDWVRWIGEAFVGLLQMSVLPYVALSLICNVARLSARNGGRLAKVGFGVLALLWCIGLLCLAAISFSFPVWKGGSFFSTSLIEEPSRLNWLELFIPSNPFFSFANSLVPAIVLFSIGLGVALMGVPDKESLLEKLEVLVTGLGRLNGMIVRLAPIGVFGIVGHAAGTLSPGQFNLLQGYLLVYGAASVLISLWILPTLIACCTPYGEREVLSHAREMLITSFVIGNTFAVLPLIVDAAKRLTQAVGDDELHSPEYTVQLAYPFPDLSRVLLMVFIPFAAWFYGLRIEPASYPQLLGVGFLGAFAKPVVTVPLLLDLAQIPGDIFNLFLAVSVIASRFGDMLKSMHLLTFAILTTSILAGRFRLDVGRLVFRSLVTAALLAIVVLSIRLSLGTFTNKYGRENLVAAKRLLGKPVRNRILQESMASPQPLTNQEDPMDRILRRKRMRIGVDVRKLPFSYVNGEGALVGFDIDLAHQLARDLGVEIEFVIYSGDVIEPLKSDHFDLAISGLEGTIRRSTELPDMEVYLEVTQALVVADYRRRQFRSLKRAAEELDGRHLRVAVIRDSFSDEMRDEETTLGAGRGAIISSGLVDQVEFVDIRSEQDFFVNYPDLADMLLTSAEAGSAWTLVHPEFSVVKPTEVNVRIPLYFLVARRSRFKDFVNSWLKLKRRDGTLDQLYDHWILGKSPRTEKPRWCIARDVLGWID